MEDWKTDSEEIAIKLPQLLIHTTKHLCHWLSDILPQMDMAWWSSLVLPNLSAPQRDRVDRQGIDSLRQLDLAALLRITERNWYGFSQIFGIDYHGVNYVREMKGIRNRWAHLDSTALNPDDIYRDVDTLLRFLGMLDAPGKLINEIDDLKKRLMGIQKSARSATHAEERQETKLQPSRKTGKSGEIEPGAIVALKSDPEKKGAVLSVEGSDPSSRCVVFMEGEPRPFYLSQLQVVVEERETNIVQLDKLHSLLTALQIQHPSLSTLYSLNAARIDFVPYQFRPALKIIRSDQPRLLIADSVGVGKTIEAGLILRELQARNDIDSVLIICPKPLVAERKWEWEMKRFDEDFISVNGRELRYCIRETDLEGEWPDSHKRAIIPYSLLQDETVLYGQKEGNRKRQGLLDLDPPPKFDFVIVDEAHHARNSNTYTHKAVRYFCENAEAVVFLTATPVQLGNQDLFTLLNLLRPDLVIDTDTFEHMSQPNPYINKAVNIARIAEDGWETEAQEKLLQAAQTGWGNAILRNNPAFKETVGKLNDTKIPREERVSMIRQMESFHSFSRLINRTRRRDIGAFCTRKPKTIEVPFTEGQAQLHDDLLEFQAKALMAVHGEQNVKFMMSTIRRQASSCIFGLAPFMNDLLARRLSELEWLESSDEDLPAMECLESLKNDAMNIVDQVNSLSPKDPKYDALLDVINEKILLQNNKIMVFSSFRHTLGYIENRLQCDGIRIGLVHGDVKDEDRMALRNRFELPKEQTEAIDVMLFSEVGCEGLDYQFCDMIINYDLPWNPMRIEQRIGRIDRRQQKSEAVAIYNMITPGTIDADIYHRCLVRIGVFESSIGECEEILGEINKEIHTIAENLELTEEERQRKLEQLADNEVGKIQEQRILEDREHELFGLKLPPNSSERDVQDAESCWLTPFAIQRFVSQYLRERLGDSDYILGDNPLKTLRLSQNAREEILCDYRKLSHKKNPMFRKWEKWLKSDKPHASVTFDSNCAADNRNTFFIMPLHPLVLQASIYFEPLEPVYTALGVQAEDAEAGDYMFAIYAWELKGLNPQLRLIPVCNDKTIGQNIFDYIESGVPLPASKHVLSDNAKKDLDRIHFGIWQQEKSSHQKRTEEIVQFRRESLETSYRGRVNVIETQLAEAEDEKIIKMKQSQMKNAQQDYEQKILELEKAQSSADIHARPIVFGKLIVGDSDAK